MSIGCELLTRPGLLLLDEPTTGLDSTNAARVVDILAELAGRQGVTVLLSIHQPRPDIFRLMDRVLLLSGEGQVRPCAVLIMHGHEVACPVALCRASTQKGAGCSMTAFGQRATVAIAAAAPLAATAQLLLQAHASTGAE